jgi:hypothetical protein
VTLAIEMSSLRILEVLAVFLHTANINFDKTINIILAHTEGYSVHKLFHKCDLSSLYRIIDAVWYWKRFRTFRRNIMPPSSGYVG